MKVCDIKGCHKPHHGRGYCLAHYDEIIRKRKEQRGKSPWTEEVKARMADLLREGLSANQIAARLGPEVGVSKNAVVSVVFRDPVLRAIGLGGGVNVVRKRSAAYQKRADAEKNAMKREMTANKRAAGIPNISGASVDRSALLLMAQIPDDTRDLTARMFGDPLPGRRAIDRLQCRSVPMVKLKPGECKWPVNEAGPGEIHLFCGLKAEPDKPYCSCHVALAYRQQTVFRRAA